jgi:hypothetical protein
VHICCVHDPGQKSWWGGGGVIKFHEILQQICENLEGWSKIFQKMTVFGQIFPFLAQFFLWVGIGYDF